jgi:hypothetical protein
MKTYNFEININLLDLGLEAENKEHAIELLKLKYEDLHDITLHDSEITVLEEESEE